MSQEKGREARGGGEGEEEEGQRPAVRQEDLDQAKKNLGSGGPKKSKTLQVMDEYEKSGKVAPSVFSGARSGGETALNTRSSPPARK
uniref:musculoskeletal embryonic nuclear protein 1a n=1 Tax=Doryrhamphus excisus TaxID=161450 RepID=UPI0025ADA2FE|nr:musculoskeletal embryonic nuclear protein 1a [Doryrhamphus excisus]